MASKSKQETPKSDNPADGVNTELVSKFQSALNFQAELSAYERAIVLLRGGVVSAKGIKLSLEVASADGSLPTLKPSHAQYFLLSSAVRELEGAKSKSLKDVLNVTIQGKKNFGAQGFPALIASSSSFDDLASKIPAQVKSGTGTRQDIKNMDDLTIYFVDKARTFDDLLPKNPKAWENFRAMVTAIENAIRANHPSAKGAKVNA